MKYVAFITVLLSFSFFSCSKSDGDDNGKKTFGQIIIDGVTKDITVFDCPVTGVNNHGDVCAYGLSYEENGRVWVLSVVTDDASCDDLFSGNVMVNDWVIQWNRADDPLTAYIGLASNVTWSSTTVRFNNTVLTNIADNRLRVTISSIGIISCDP